MSCGCKNKGNLELPASESKPLFSNIKDYTIRVVLFILLIPVIIPITIGAFFYVIVINKSNIDGFTLMKIVVKVLKNALKDEYEEEDEDEEEDDDEEFNEDDYELDEIIH